MGNCFTKDEDKYKTPNNDTKSNHNSTLMTSTNGNLNEEVVYQDSKSVSEDEVRRLK